MGKGARKTGGGNKKYNPAHIGPAARTRKPADFAALAGAGLPPLVADPRAGCDTDAIGKNRSKKE